MESSFASAITALLKDEGGYVNDPNDPGGETIYGISKKFHPEMWANGIPKFEDAAGFYKREYWVPAFGNDLPRKIDDMVFNAAVNLGADTAVRLLQKSVGVFSDGQVGMRTLAAIQSKLPVVVIGNFCIWWMHYYGERPGFKFYGTGWRNRVTKTFNRLLMEA